MKTTLVKICFLLVLLFPVSGFAATQAILIDPANSNLSYVTFGPYTNINELGDTLFAITNTDTHRIEQYLDSEDQAFTAAGGYEIVTNLTVSTNSGIFTTTHSNITVDVTGNYLALCIASWESSAVNTFSHGHLFVDGVEVSRIGWSTKLAVANDQGSAGGNGLIRIAAGSSVDLRIDVDKNSTFGFDHLNLVLVDMSFIGAGGAITTNDFLQSFNQGLWADYLNTTSVTVNVGEIYCNGSYYNVTQAFVNTVQSLYGLSAVDFHYQYLDDSASTANSGSITVFWSTNEPTFSDILQGWYCTTSGADRVINTVYGTATTNVTQYSMFGEGWNTLSNRITLASDMNPDGTWQTPDDSESSVFLPVNAVYVKLRGEADDAGSSAGLNIAAKEHSDMSPSIVFGSMYGYAFRQIFNVVFPWMELGASRNVRIAGNDNDDNTLGLQLMGWRMER